MENTAKNESGNYPQATGWYWWRASENDEWMVVRVLCWAEQSDITGRGFPWGDSQVSLPAMAAGKYGPQYQMESWEWVKIHEPNESR
jgi:hypothetical protein